MKKTAIILVLCLVILSLAAGCRSEEEQQVHAQQQQQQRQEILLKQEATEEKKVLRVTGCGEISTMPDLATVRLSVSSESGTSEEAASKLQEKILSITQVLLDMHISRADIRTEEITLYPLQDHEKNPPVTTGYSATTTIVILVHDTAQVGNIVGAAIQAGAMEIQDISFELLDETTVYHQALAAAVEDATAKAQIIADTAGLKLQGPVLMEEVSTSIQAAEEAAVTSEGSEDLQLPLEVTPLSVFAQVLVEYKLG